MGGMLKIIQEYQLSNTMSLFDITFGFTINHDIRLQNE